MCQEVEVLYRQHISDRLGYAEFDTSTFILYPSKERKNDQSTTWVVKPCCCCSIKTDTDSEDR